MKFPEHKAAMIIYHNDYKNNYDSIEEAVECEFNDWVSEEEKQKALETGEIWQVQWYPDTPIGFCVVSASTLEAALESANAN